MTEEQPLGIVVKTVVKNLPVEFEGQNVGRVILYERDNDGNQYCDQFFSSEFNELIIKHNNELRFSEISENVDVVTVTRINTGCYNHD